MWLRFKSARLRPEMNKALLLWQQCEAVTRVDWLDGSLDAWLRKSLWVSICSAPQEILTADMSLNSHTHTHTHKHTHTHTHITPLT